MLHISATIHVGSSAAAPKFHHHNTENGCVQVLLSGKNVYGPYVALYGTADEVRNFLLSAVAVLDGPAEMELEVGIPVVV